MSHGGGPATSVSLMKVSTQRIRNIALAFLRATGSDEHEAGVVADDLVEANLRGHDSHGVGLIPIYAHDVHTGTLRPNSGPRLLHDAGAVLQYDGLGGYGQRVGREITRAAIERSGELGVCVATVRGVHHLGRIGGYGEQAAASGRISIHYVNVPGFEPIVAPFNGSDGRLSTNPTCIAIPGSQASGDFVMDFATSAVALGKLRVAHLAHRSFDQDVTVSASGERTPSPEPMFSEPRGAMLPAAGHKGYGLAMACELLASLLSGGETVRPKPGQGHAAINNMTEILIDPAHFAPLDAFHAEMDALVDFVKASPAPDPEHHPVLMPGEPERRERARRLAQGVEISGDEWRAIARACEGVGVDPGLFAAGKAA